MFTGVSKGELVQKWWVTVTWKDSGANQRQQAQPAPTTGWWLEQDIDRAEESKIYLKTVVTQESFFCRLRLPNERLPNHQPLLQPLWAHAQGHHGEKHQKVQKGLKTHVEKELKSIPKLKRYRRDLEREGNPLAEKSGEGGKKLSRNKKLFMGRHPVTEFNKICKKGKLFYLDHQQFWPKFHYPSKRRTEHNNGKQ